MANWRYEDRDLQGSNAGNQEGNGDTLTVSGDAQEDTPKRGKHPEYRTEHISFKAFGHQRIDFQGKVGILE